MCLESLPRFATGEYLNSYICTENPLFQMSFDLSLARGLDYYTGLIYEAVIEGSAPPLAPAALAPSQAIAPNAPSKSKKKKEKAPALDAEGEPEVDESTIGVGSIAAGGRYDELVGMFASAASSSSSSSSGIPCVGVSVGVERVFSILMQKEKEKAAAAGVAAHGRKNETEAYVMSVGDGLLIERMQVAKELWAAGIKVSVDNSRYTVLGDIILSSQTEFMYKAKPKLQKQFEVVDKEQVPFAVIIGPDELKEGYVRVKEQRGKDASGNSDGEKVKRENLILWLKERLTNL